MQYPAKGLFGIKRLVTAKKNLYQTCSLISPSETTQRGNPKRSKHHAMSKRMPKSKLNHR
jgi:hypothetical protein